MSGPESMKPDDHLLDEFLAGEGSVRAAYDETASAQPPSALDAAILQRAASATAPTAMRPAVRPRWQLPMATAAVLMLSLGVLLQVQRDPVVQQQLAPLEQPPPAAEAVADAPFKAEAAPLQEAEKVEKKQASIAAARPKAVDRPVANAPAAAPPPPAPVAMAMSDAAGAAAPVAAAMAQAQDLEQATVSSDMASEASQRQQAVAAAPMAKASRAAPMTHLMRQADTPALAASDSSPAISVEQWAQHCAVEVVAFDAAIRWRGLPLAALTRQTAGGKISTTLQFAPEVSEQALAAALGPLAVRASFSGSDCATLVTRELRRAETGWALVCECAAP